MTGEVTVFNRLALLPLVVVPVWATTAIHAQDNRWTVGFDVGRASVHGASRDTASGDDRAFRPDSPTVVSLRVGRRLGVGGITLGIVGTYGEAGLGLGGPDLLLVDHTTRFAFYEIAPVIGVRLTGLGPNGALTVNAGPVLSRWTLTDQPDRTLIGGRVGLGVPVWFGQQVGGAVRLEGVVTPSVFEEGELPVEFLLTTTWRVQLSVGIVAGW